MRRVRCCHSGDRRMLCGPREAPFDEVVRLCRSKFGLSAATMPDGGDGAEAEVRLRCADPPGSTTLRRSPATPISGTCCARTATASSSIGGGGRQPRRRSWRRARRRRQWRDSGRAERAGDAERAVRDTTRTGGGGGGGEHGQHPRECARAGDGARHVHVGAAEWGARRALWGGGNDRVAAVVARVASSAAADCDSARAAAARAAALPAGAAAASTSAPVPPPPPPPPAPRTAAAPARNRRPRPRPRPARRTERRRRQVGRGGAIGTGRSMCSRCGRRWRPKRARGGPEGPRGGLPQATDLKLRDERSQVCEVLKRRRGAVRRRGIAARALP